MFVGAHPTVSAKSSAAAAYVFTAENMIVAAPTATRPQVSYNAPVLRRLRRVLGAHIDAPCPRSSTNRSSRSRHDRGAACENTGRAPANGLRCEPHDAPAVG